MVLYEDTAEIREVVKEDTIEKVRGNKNRATGVDSPMVDEEVEKCFWIIIPGYVEGDRTTSHPHSNGP